MLLKNFQSGFYYGNDSKAVKMDGGGYNKAVLNNLGYNNPDCHYGGNTANTAYHVVIGAGTTEPTTSDYDLADSSIMASNKMASLIQSATNSEAGGTTIMTQWQNLSGSAITVKEVGLAFKLAVGSYNKSSNILVARKVLDTFVTIQPNEVYAFSYNIKV